MSGHSKWAQIKRQKGYEDVKRGAQFTKLGSAITIAVREGGGISDPESNFKLRLAIERARGANMPKENIERAIKKGGGGGEGASLFEVVYEGFVPGGVAVIIEAVTDNKQRTVAEVKNTLEKNGGTLGAQGSVAYLFVRNGELKIKKNGKILDSILQDVLIDGVDDVEEEGDSVYIYTTVVDFQNIKKNLETKGYLIEDVSIIYRPKSLILISDKNLQERIISILEKLEGLDSVQAVYSNMDMSSIDV